ncbi:hypothetical protein Pjdr2_4745 [Paenibacillus sp. JDR-2]|nr:hypothetical protein Pjdr2_4745 [Paenibacillus sp. JDR-2]
MYLESYLSYWNQFYASGKYDLKEALPAEVISYFDADFYPEPFYGYLNEDMSNDALLLLINPGDILIDKLRKSNPSLDYEGICRQFNDFVGNRYLNWTKEDYIHNEVINRTTPGGKWRASRLKQLEQLTNENLGFLHTLEFFPFHSKQWNVRKSLKEEWLYELESTQLAMQAIGDISTQRKTKHIVGIGLDWVVLFGKYPELFERTNEYTITGKTGKPAHRVFQFKVKGNSDSLPIVIYSGSSMNLPVGTDSAVRLLRQALELEAIKIG